MEYLFLTFRGILIVKDSTQIKLVSWLTINHNRRKGDDDIYILPHEHIHSFIIQFDNL